MPALSFPEPGSVPPKVLVTGANGYIGMWVIRTLLEKGFAVRGVVRSKEKVELMKKTFENGIHDEWNERVEWGIVENITKEGAFDALVQGVEGVVHTASPLDITTGDPDEYIHPAVNGTLSLLTSALKSGSSLKRIVITSSCSACTTTKDTTPSIPRIFRETDWADDAVEIVKAEGRNAAELMKYRASKTLSEKATLDFVSHRKDTINWDLTTILPSITIGPNLCSPSSPKTLNASLNRFYRSIFTDEPDDFLKSTTNPVDVRDVALAHVAALTTQDAGGERIIISRQAITWQHIRDMAYNINATWYTEGVLPRGNPSLPHDVSFRFENEKSKRILGLEYTSLEQTIGDTMADFEGRGWVEKKISS